MCVCGGCGGCGVLRHDRVCVGRRRGERLRARGADVRGLVPCVGIGAAASHCEMCRRVVGGAVGDGGLTLRKLPELAGGRRFGARRADLALAQLSLT